MAAMTKWVPRLVLALAIGVALPFLPTFLTQSVGPAASGGGGLGLSAGVSAGTFAALFLGGILPSLTPCVYPLIPITVRIFGARQAEPRGPSVALSATHVPVLAGVLTYVAAQRNAVLGFWMLFTYAIGMGMLFFVLGATSLRLPRSGPWMETVKSVLGIALVAAAFALVLPFLPRPGSLPLSARSVAIAAGLLGFAGVVAGALSLSFHGGSREKAVKLGALLLLLLGVGLCFGWLGEPRSEKPFAIPWLHDERLAVQQSQATGKQLLKGVQ